MPLPLPGDAGAPADAYVEVALVPALAGKDLLTYRLEDEHRGRVRPGVRVLVPLGRRRETGLVVGLAAHPPAGLTAIRSVLEVLDAEPILTPDLFALARWAARYYCTTLAEVLAAALPGGLRASSTRLVRLADPVTDERGRTPLEQAIVRHLDGAGGATLAHLARAVAPAPRAPGLARAHAARVATAVRALERRGVVTVEDHLRGPRGTTKRERLVGLAQTLSAADAATLARRAPRQHAVYERLRDAPGRVLAVANLSPAERIGADALVRRGVAEHRHEERYRAALPAPGPIPPAGAPALALTASQQAAVDAVAASAGFAVFLLHGVTGSGKTEVYLRLAARTRAAGRGVLFLVPEIALTHELVRRVAERFGNEAAVLHSGLAPGERWDEWRRVARGEARVVVGTRSAVFAPLADLGLVVVDEEHDGAYKQDEGLRYSGRDLALVRAQHAGAPAVLGSATPSAESYQQALDGRYRLLTLPARVAGRPLPAVELVDLRRRGARLPRATPAAGEAAAGEGAAGGAPRTLRDGGTTTAPSARAGPREPPDETPATTTLFSAALLDAIAMTLARREQVLLFLNRRGFARTLQCLACGEPAGCPACSVSLTLHARRAVLLCHHCGYARPAGGSCAGCGSAALAALHDGTERVEAEIAARFPAARVGRLDRDTTGRKGAHARILDAWRAGALDILIGTQMVAKGHDVPAVTLVGVLLADVALSMPDFRAAERTFQLLTQVAGRAGRGDAPGRVLVQTYRPEHHSLVAAAAHDYAGFAPRELALRRELGYPPFARLAALRLEGVDAAATERAAAALAADARARATSTAVTIRGPAPAPLERLRGRYRWHLLLSSASARALHTLLAPLLAAWRARAAARTIRLVVDIDPVSML